MIIIVFKCLSLPTLVHSSKQFRVDSGPDKRQVVGVTETVVDDILVYLAALFLGVVCQADRETFFT